MSAKCKCVAGGSPPNTDWRRKVLHHVPSQSRAQRHTENEVRHRGAFRKTATQRRTRVSAKLLNRDLKLRPATYQHGSVVIFASRMM